MNTLKCLIVDDEAPAIRLLESYVKKVSFLELVGSTTDPIEAISIIEKEALDLVFLDIQMPTITGIQLSKIIKDKVNVIFTTAYPQFAIESYELNAIDYLLKPFEFERFYNAILKVKPKENIKPISKSDEFIFIKTDGKNNFEKVYTNEILYIESLKNYVSLHLENKEVITYSTLKHFDTELSSKSFIKIHKSYIVAIQHIAKTDSLSVYLTNGKNLPIGDTYKKNFFEKINKLIL
ncbi:response regulator transcription factor [Tenacibaculum aiptasiae]|uniref:Response regulator transcription factor n=1 Tax=Tenacibaculum aiptasiae TaxID=426481 RepID=A0A7J5AQ17_9FLAO|nr:LytTR family DNA-binding domain-containing protein [Tenacibaculum aiptasiae]KAB1159719.1 response regulator transcription factor [Tenacibaculum aiptasiae]